MKLHIPPHLLSDLASFHARALSVVTIYHNAYCRIAVERARPGGSSAGTQLLLHLKTAGLRFGATSAGPMATNTQAISLVEDTWLITYEVHMRWERRRKRKLWTSAPSTFSMQKNSMALLRED